MKTNLSLAAALSFASTAFSITIRDYQPLRHDRFYTGNDKAFVGDPYDFSGVGLSNNGTWASLISDSYFISANHFHPSSGVTFWEDNSLSGPSHSYTIAGGQQIGSTDLWVGWFTSTVDASIARYPILDLPLANDYIGLVGYNYGITNRVGLNVIEDVQFISPGFPNSYVFIYDYDNNDVPSVGGDETFLETGDSGAPSFSISSGMLALTGVHAGIDSPLFADTAIPAYIAEINAVLDDQGQSVTLVPEPGAGMLIFAGMGWITGTIRRRNI